MLCPTSWVHFRGRGALFCDRTNTMTFTAVEVVREVAAAVEEQETGVAGVPWTERT